MARPKLTAEQKETARLLVGKTIRRVILRPFDTERPGDSEPTTDPIIVFTDGTRLAFVVEETDSGACYGVRLIHPAK